MILCSVYVAVLFFRKRRRFPDAWVISTAILTAILGVAFLLGGAGDFIFLKCFVWSALWWLYLIRSKRVEHTFVK
jgi:4-hydroxybenzoate polyprenyltransferase